ncbi:MAG TPA: hypothetical protein VHH36_03960, partial [Candidatus Thermoplasmatota archaeon]|nr:hypothetical protein [Candidatus Thermoplasmatota archaeon]
MAFRLSCMLTALAVLVAGCASDPADDAGATAGGNETSTGAGAPAPNDDGTKPVEVAAADTGHMPHMHDYWSNRERVTLFDGPI